METTVFFQHRQLHRILLLSPVILFLNSCVLPAMYFALNENAIQYNTIQHNTIQSKTYFFPFREAVHGDYCLVSTSKTYFFHFREALYGGVTSFVLPKQSHRPQPIRAAISTTNQPLNKDDFQPKTATSSRGESATQFRPRRPRDYGDRRCWGHDGRH